MSLTRASCLAGRSGQPCFKAQRRWRTSSRLAQQRAVPPPHTGADPSPAAPEASTSGRLDEDPPPVASAAAVPAPPFPPHVFLDELLRGEILEQARAAFPKVPWGPTQLLQVIGWGGALAVVAVAAGTQTPQADVLAASATQGAAVRHLGLELFCVFLAVAVLRMALGRSQPFKKGFFSFALDGGSAQTTALLAAVLYPLADPVLYSLWKPLQESVVALPDSGATLVAALRQCVAQGDYASLAAHVAASCAVGPLWEETFWRGFFLASMTKVLPLPACVGASSTVFALLHLGPGNLLPIAMLSAACDVLYLRTRSLAPPLLFHMGYNAYQVLGIVALHKETFV